MVRQSFLVILSLALVFTAGLCSAQESGETTTGHEVVEEAVVRNSASEVEGSGAASKTCSCDNTEEPICASNGVTYKNSCRFECSKKRVKRLRIVKRGRCNGVTLNQYRGTQPSRPKNPSPSLDSIFNSFFSS